MKLPYVPVAMAVLVSALVNVVSSNPEAVTAAAPWARWTTRGPQGFNLDGKMFTLSVNTGGISFYAPYLFTTTNRYPTRKYATTRPYTTTTRPYTTTTRPYTTTTRPYTTTTGPYTTTTRPYTTTTRPYTTTTGPYTTTTRPYTTTTRPYTTSAPPTRGVSVCLRYLSDYQSIRLTLSPSSRAPLSLEWTSSRFRVTFSRYGSSYMSFQPSILFWPYIQPDIWNRICLTIDSTRNVGQMFSGSSMSIRKLLPTWYAWSGEPVIDISGFDGQVTDIQVWDYPLSYKEIFNYMNNGAYRSYRGSVLTWSSISYSPRGNALLEDSYKSQARQPISHWGEWHQLKGKKRTREFYNFKEGSYKKSQLV